MGNHVTTKAQGKLTGRSLRTLGIKMHRDMKADPGIDRWKVYIRDSQAEAPPIAGLLTRPRQQRMLRYRWYAQPTKICTKATGLKPAYFESLTEGAEYLKTCYVTNKLLGSST